MKHKISNSIQVGNRDLETLSGMDGEALEALTAGSGIKIPEELLDSTEELVDYLDASDKIMPEKQPVSQIRLVRNTGRMLWTRIFATAACVATVAVMSFAYNSISGRAVPEDTFSDPALAYAEIERVLGNISEKTAMASKGLGRAETAIEKQINIFR